MGHTYAVHFDRLDGPYVVGYISSAHMHDPFSVINSSEAVMKGLYFMGHIFSAHMHDPFSMIKTSYEFSLFHGPKFLALMHDPY